MAHLFKTLSAVAIVAASTTTASLAIGSHGGGGTSPGTGAATTYEYARYCTGDLGPHDSTESFTTIAGSAHVKSTTALVLTTAANGASLPYAYLQDPRYPAMVALDFDVLGANNGTFAEVVFADNDGLLNAALWDLTNKQKTSPLATTPSGWTHYRLTPGNADELFNSPIGNKATFVTGAVGQTPASNTTRTVSLANFGLNSTFGAPNVTIVTTASVDDCEPLF